VTDHDPFRGPPADWHPELDKIISDDEVRKFLKTKGLDPRTQPAFCEEAVAKHWDLPIVEASRMVRYL
jgi:hypothetical protein